MRAPLFTLDAYVAPLVQHPRYSAPVHHFQALSSDLFDQGRSMVITARTGVGKTWAALAPALMAQKSIFITAPVMALQDDYMRSLKGYIERAGFKEPVYLIDGKEAIDLDRFYTASWVIAQVNSLTLEQLQKQLRARSKGAVLNWLLSYKRDRMIMVGTMDSLVLLTWLRYSQSDQSVASLANFPVLLIDEAHKYSAPELAIVLNTVSLARLFQAFSQVILLTATPDEDLRDILTALWQPEFFNDRTAISDPRTQGYPMLSQGRKALHEAEVIAVKRGVNPAETAFKQVMREWDNLVKLRAANPDPFYVPMVVILNSVQEAITLERNLEAAGISMNRIGSVRGLMDPAARDVKNKVIIVGTSAIEVGVDFVTDMLLMEASDTASFMQRLGRLARHRPGRLYLIAREEERKWLEELATIRKVWSRDEFEDRVMADQIYRRPNSRISFLRSVWSIFLTHATYTELIGKIAEDERAAPEERRAVVDRLWGTFAEFYRTIGAEQAFRQARIILELAESSPEHWLRILRENASFRSSLSFPVFDRDEARARDGKGKYQAPFHTLLRRGEGIVETEDGLEIDGYGAYRQVKIRRNGDAPDGFPVSLRKAFPNLQVLREDTGAMPQMTRKLFDQDHVAVLLPGRMRERLGWQIVSYPCDDGRIMVLDQDAMVALYEWERDRAGRTP